MNFTSEKTQYQLPPQGEGLSYQQHDALMTSLEKPAVDETKRKQLVCRYWLQDKCLHSGSKCDYIHAYVKERMPICERLKKYGSCNLGNDCDYTHPGGHNGSQGVGQVSNYQEEAYQCPYYERGFCKLGSDCKFRHVTQTQVSEDTFVQTRICVNFTLGFCPRGPKCEFKHIRGMINPKDLDLSIMANFNPEENFIDQSELKQRRFQNDNNVQQFTCHRCGSAGHKSTFCQEEKISREQLETIRRNNPNDAYLSMNAVCRRCNMQGHYAQDCPKGQQEGSKEMYDQMIAWQRQQQLIQTASFLMQQMGKGMGSPMQDNSSIVCQEDTATCTPKSQPILSATTQESSGATQENKQFE